MSTTTILLNSSYLLLQGTLTTLGIWITAACVALGIGFIWGALRAERLRVPYISMIVDGITFLLRGIPFYVQLLIAYFVLPELSGIELSASVTAALTLGLCSAAYVSQILCGGINAIAVGQWEAAYVLGYTKAQTLRFIVVPQTLRYVISALGGEFDQLLKSTALASSFGVLEVTRAGMNIISREMCPMTIYLALAAIYLALSSLLNALTYKLGRVFDDKRN
jgi:His/Glu/Gln/Arg/opine family amino acid ABC transporter permease subunit